MSPRGISSQPPFDFLSHPDLKPPMHLPLYSFAIFVLRSLSVFAQQKCYWPDGSSVKPDQGYWVNCYSTQASTCCGDGDVCLSNGLCYESNLGMVRPGDPREPFEQSTDHQAKTYRGGCTLNDWDNTTACPNQWCNDGKDSLDC